MTEWFEGEALGKRHVGLQWVYVRKSCEEDPNRERGKHGMCVMWRTNKMVATPRRCVQRQRREREKMEKGSETEEKD